MEVITINKILLLFFLFSTFTYCDDWFNSIENNNIKSATLLLKSGTNINCKDKFGDTALIIATKNNLLEMITFLIQNGAK